jgi:hypothetical protein
MVYSYYEDETLQQMQQMRQTEGLLPKVLPGLLAGIQQNSLEG